MEERPGHRGGDFSSIDLEERLTELLVRHEVDTIGRPHIVVCSYPMGSATYIGPFPDGAAAIAAARREEEVLRTELPGLPVDVWVAVLEPDPGLAQCGFGP